MYLYEARLCVLAVHVPETARRTMLCLHRVLDPGQVLHLHWLVSFKKV